MGTVLMVLGGIVLVGGTILGILVGMAVESFWVFLSYIIGTSTVAMISFGVAQLLNNQQVLFEALEEVKSYTKPQEITTTCTKCKKTYEVTYSTCPYCGYRGESK